MKAANTLNQSKNHLWINKVLSPFILFIVFFLYCFTSFSQQDCRPYVPPSEGDTWEITSYSDKGKEMGRIYYELIEKKESGNEIIFTIKSTSYDKKGENIFNNTFSAKCVDGKFEFDMTFRMNGSSMQAYKDMDVKVDASKFELPSFDESVGTKLDDGTMTIGLEASGSMMFNMSIFITDRIIDSKETLTTPAGEFNCIVLSQNITTKTMMKVTASSKEWYAEDIGMIRSEQYNSNGKLMGYSELTALKRK